MNVMPTLEGGLVIEPSSDLDWHVLTMITQDIGRPAHLAESLADLMNNDSDWEEYVVPDIAASFDQQASYVENMIQNAKKQNHPTIFIKPTDAQQWYGVLNQARLALEARYSLSSFDEIDPTQEEVHSAYLRDRFYSRLQYMVLEYIFEET